MKLTMTFLFLKKKGKTKANNNGFSFSNIYKYICGRHDSLDKAKASLLNISKKFPEAFVVEIKGTEVKRVK